VSAGAPSSPVIPVMRPFLGEEEAQAAADAVRSGWVAQGPRVRDFEDEFCRVVGARNAIAVSSCTTALQLALASLDFDRGDEVIVPSLSFIATANCAQVQGFRPVFADVEIATGNVTTETIAEVITPRTRAVIVVHQTGTPADVHRIHELCDPKGIHVLEDAACAIGATYKGAPIGTHSAQVTFSFHPRKVITTGEGGMLTVADEEHGMSVSAADRHGAGAVIIESYTEPGFNFRMTDIQAAVGLVQLRRLDAIVARRRAIAAHYTEALGAIPGVITATDPDYGTSNFQGFWALLPDDSPHTQQTFLEALLVRGISARRGVMASHLEPAYADHAHVPLPNTEKLSRRSVILPLFHTLTEGEIDHIAEAFVSAMRSGV
jgi:dTDP-4-amino-4,6-dideoxygalactose transaminase